MTRKTKHATRSLTMVKDWIAELKEFAEIAGYLPTQFDSPEAKEAKTKALYEMQLGSQRIIKFARQLVAITEKERDNDE
jgi:hypothetical protein